jgi:hypothetical protein
LILHCLENCFQNFWSNWLHLAKYSTFKPECQCCISLINFNFFNPMYKGLMYGTRIKIKLRPSHKYTHFPTLTSYIADAELSTPCRINSCTSLSLDKGCT